MALSDDIAAKLSALDHQYGPGVWGYDPDKMAWFSTEHGRRVYQNTDMGLPASVHNALSGAIGQSEQGGGLLHGRPVWDSKQGKFVTPFSWDKLATYGTLGALTAGAADALAAGGGGAAALGTLGPSTPANIAATEAAAAAPAALTGGAAAGAGLGADILKHLTSPGGITALASLIPMLAGAGRGQSGGGSTAMPQGLQDMLTMSVQRAQRTDPLHQAVTQLAFSRLPDASRNGISLTGK